MIKARNSDKRLQQNYSDDDFPLFPDISEHISGWSQMHRLMSLFMSLKSQTARELVIDFAAMLLEKQKKDN